MLEIGVETLTMARQWLWMCVWVVALVVSGSAHSRRQNDNKKGPEAVLVETLRQVLGVPKSEGGPGFHHKTHRPPRYMVHLYQRITDGHSTLPRRANTVRSYTPKSDDGSQGSLLVYNVSASSGEHVMGAWLNVRGGGVKARIPPRPRPTRVLLYLLHAPHWQPSTPIITVTANPGEQEVEVTRAVREALGGGNLLTPSDNAMHLLGVRVEELRHGRYVSRPPPKLAKNPPLLVVYSSDPKLLDLAAVGTPTLNLTVNEVQAAYGKAAHGRNAHHHYTHHRYAREAQQHAQKRVERAASSEGPWAEMGVATEQDEDDVIPDSHAHAIMTNELPLATSRDLELPEKPKKKKKLAREGAGRRGGRAGGRGRRKHKGRDDNLIPLPENYSKARWGDDAHRRRNRRRRRNRKLPDEWMKEAQNHISNDANSLSSLTGVVGGKGGARVCERHQLEINIKELGWDQWIVMPTFFNAYYCAGVCPSPLTKSLSGSNHAIIQSLIYVLGGRPEVPAPCCVPEKLDAISLLFQEGDDGSKYLLKNYPKMSVSSCSCQ